MEIPLNDLSRAVQESQPQLLEAVRRVIDSGVFLLGKENQAFASELSSLLRVKHVVTVANGTDALEISLTALGVGVGDRVVTVANAGGYATTSIFKVGAEPVFVDIDLQHMQMDPDSLRAFLSQGPGVAAVVVTHLFGQVAPIEAIAEICLEFSVPLVEDCAQALGATIRGKSVGTFGDVATTSFYPTKNLGGLGDGGAIFTDDSEIAGRAMQLRQYGWGERYQSVIAHGRNSRLDEIQAAILRFQLVKFSHKTHRRRQIHSVLHEVKSPWGRFAHSSGEDFVAHLSVFVTDRRNELISHLDKHGVGWAIHYPIPDHLQPTYLHSERWHLPVTEKMASKIISLPSFPELSDDEVSRVVHALQIDA